MSEDPRSCDLRCSLADRTGRHVGQIGEAEFPIFWRLSTLVLQLPKSSLRRPGDTFTEATKLRSNSRVICRPTIGWPDFGPTYVPKFG